MLRHRIAFALCLAVLLTLSSAAFAQYTLTNLVSNQVGKSVKPADPLLVNAWGLVYGPGGPWWVSDEGSGWSTLYNAFGAKQGLQVVIPSATGKGPGSPTGIVFNNSSGFPVGGWPSLFIFATLDGTISGWTFKSNPNAAIIAVTTPGASYTGLAITNNPTASNFLYAVDNANAVVDVYDVNFSLVGTLVDSTIPAGFAPFGIQDIDGVVYVSYAATNGGLGGYIDMFTESGTLIKRLAEGAPLNQPWGFAAAPNNFGPLSNTLLVSNNINNTSTINAFNALTGKFVGTMKDTTGAAIHIDQLWGIAFGGGNNSSGESNSLYFTAGPSNNLAGTFGVIKP